MPRGEVIVIKAKVGNGHGEKWQTTRGVDVFAESYLLSQFRAKNANKIRIVDALADELRESNSVIIPQKLKAKLQALA